MYSNFCHVLRVFLIYFEGIFIMKSIGVYVAFEEDKLLNDQLYPLYHD